MSAIFLTQKMDISDQIIKEEYLKIINRYFIIRSDYTTVRTVSLDFKDDIADADVHTSLKSFIDLFLDDFPYSKAAATVWTDRYTCVITVNPVGGAA